MTDNTINNDMTMGGASGTLLAGRYRVVRQLGQGGMGSVWLAEDEKLDGFKVAIKMLPSVLVSNKRAYAQVKQEALVSLKLSHPNIATVRAFEEESGSPFLVMDYIDGQTLDDYLAEKGKLSENEAIRLLKPVAAALDYAHTQGVVHRDVKPGNVMIRKDGTPFVLDFGIAREIQETMTRVTGKLSSGTLLYMSPEQLHGAAPKPLQDIYSFAAMAYECLTGHPPFERGQIEYQIEHDTPKPLPRHIAICRGVMAGLEKVPEARPGNCSALLVSIRDNTVCRFEGRLRNHQGRKRVWRWFLPVFLAGVALVFIMQYGSSVRNLYNMYSPWGWRVLLHDVSSQVTIRGGRIVCQNTIAECLGLRNGVTLSESYLQARRNELLGMIPNLKSVTFEFKRPDGLVVLVEERVPVARMGVIGCQKPTGRVTDADGVVFMQIRRTSDLPIIYEPGNSTTAKGLRLSGRSAAALELLKAFRLSNVSILQVDTSGEERLDAMLSNGAKLKIAWIGMDESPSKKSAKDLNSRLEMLAKAMDVMPGSDEGATWNSLQPDKVYLEGGS